MAAVRPGEGLLAGGCSGWCSLALRLLAAVVAARWWGHPFLTAADETFSPVRRVNISPVDCDMTRPQPVLHAFMGSFLIVLPSGDAGVHIAGRVKLQGVPASPSEVEASESSATPPAGGGIAAMGAAMGVSEVVFRCIPLWHVPRSG
jgi:hypothetical protein